MPQNKPQFYMVWNPTGVSPTVEHPTHEKAVKEAERLATSCPGHAFYVLKAISVSRISGVVTESLQPILQSDLRSCHPQ